MVGLRHPGADGPGAYSGTRAPSVPIRTYQRIRFGSVNLSESTLPADRALATSSCCSASLHDSERRVVEGPVSNEIRSLGAMTKREDTTWTRPAAASRPSSASGRYAAGPAGGLRPSYSRFRSHTCHRNPQAPVTSVAGRWRTADIRGRGLRRPASTASRMSAAQASEITLPTHCCRRPLFQRTTGLPWNLTFGGAAEKVIGGDSGRSRAGTIDEDKPPG